MIWRPLCSRQLRAGSKCRSTRFSLRRRAWERLLRYRPTLSAGYEVGACRRTLLSHLVVLVPIHDCLAYTGRS